MTYCKYFTIGIYSLVSIPIFYLVYYASESVIDEEFHLRQGQHYCNGSFDVVRVAGFFDKFCGGAMFGNV